MKNKRRKPGKRSVNEPTGHLSVSHNSRLGKKFRRFAVSISLEIDVDESLLTSVLTDEWRGKFYNFTSAGEVAEHLAFNLLGGHDVNQLDGFADQLNDAAEIIRDSMDAETEEI